MGIRSGIGPEQVDPTQLGETLLKSSELRNVTKEGAPRKRRVPLSKTHDAWLRKTGRL